MHHIPAPNSLTPAWLTAVLQQARQLKQGEATAVEQRLSNAFNSQTSFLSVHYSMDVAPALPTRFVLKQNGLEAWSKEAGAEEVKFYTTVAALPTHPPITIPCYAAAYDVASGNSFVLLQDFSETHAPPLTRDQQINLVEGVPPAVYIDAVIDTLAQLHAYWWQHPLLENETFTVGYWSRNAERFAKYLQRRKTAWESLLIKERHWFPAELRTLYEQVFAHLPSYWERYLASRFRTKTNLTLIHGDAYFANFLCPKPGVSGITYLLDWQSPTFDVGGYDLANLCAAFWSPAQRQEENREMNMLRRYHTGLCAHGVMNYSWADLCTDYQSGLIFWLLMPVQDHYGGAGRDYWWPKMQCLVAAFRDWQCETLLGLEKS